MVRLCVFQMLFNIDLEFFINPSALACVETFLTQMCGRDEHRGNAKLHDQIQNK